MALGGICWLSFAMVSRASSNSTILPDLECNYQLEKVSPIDFQYNIETISNRYMRDVFLDTFWGSTIEHALDA